MLQTKIAGDPTQAARQAAGKRPGAEATGGAKARAGR